MRLELEVEGDIVLAVIEHNGAIVEIIARVQLNGRDLCLTELHVQGGGPNSLGPTALRQLIHEVMEDLDVDTIVVGGARRTSGAGPGRRPSPLRFARKVPSRN